jgi:hypothetical protein
MSPRRIPRTISVARLAPERRRRQRQSEWGLAVSATVAFGTFLPGIPFSVYADPFTLGVTALGCGLSPGHLVGSMHGFPPHSRVNILWQVQVGGTVQVNAYDWGAQPSRHVYSENGTSGHGDFSVHGGPVYFVAYLPLPWTHVNCTDWKVTIVGTYVPLAG